MWDIRRYVDLDDPQREQLFDFTKRHDPERFPDLQRMHFAYHSGAFEHGESQFSLWHGGRVVGTMGAVVREAALRGEIFITAVAIEAGHEPGFAALLQRAYACMPQGPHHVVRMGILPGHPRLEPLVAEHGYALDYEGIVMTGPPAPFELPPDPAWRLETVSTANAEPYRRVLDEAFRASPNGATVDAEQIAELLAEIAHPDLLGVAWHGDRPVAAFELDMQGDTGWIEAIAVLPEAQGHGFGKRMLAAALERLRAQGARLVKLLVMSVNEPAVALYRRHGFGEEEVVTRWWRLQRAL